MLENTTMSGFVLTLRQKQIELQNFHDLSVWLPKICRHVLGKPLKVKASDDRRKTLVPPIYTCALKAVIKLFHVDDKLEPKYRAGRFDEFGFRDTCWAELQAIDAKYRTEGVMSRWQMNTFLKAFEKVGILERRTVYSTDTGKRKLSIRLRPDRISAMIYEVSQMWKTECALARLEEKDASNLTNKTDAFKASTSLVERESFSGFSNDISSTSSPHPVDDITSSASEKEIEAAKGGELFALDKGRQAFEAAIKLISKKLCPGDEHLTSEQIKIIKRYWTSPRVTLRMTTENLQDFFRYFDNSAEWCQTDLNGFIQCWPMFLQRTRAYAICQMNTEISATYLRDNILPQMESVFDSTVIGRMNSLMSGHCNLQASVVDPIHGFATFEALLRLKRYGDMFRFVAEHRKELRELALTCPFDITFYLKRRPVFAMILGLTQYDLGFIKLALSKLKNAVNNVAAAVDVWRSRCGQDEWVQNFIS